MSVTGSCKAQVTHKVTKVLRLIQPHILLDEVVESRGRLRACCEVTGVYLFQNPDKNIIAEVEKLGHGAGVTKEGT
jgi:hypothetical protein